MNYYDKEAMGCVAKHICELMPRATELIIPDAFFDEETAYDKLLEFERDCEKLCLEARNLAYYHCAAERVEDAITDSVKIEIEVTDDGWFRVLMTMLPRKKSNRPEVRYIRQSLYLALEKYFRTHEKVRFDKSVIIFNHIYDEATPEKKWHDHDNIEIKQVTDVLTLFLLPDDSPTFLSRFQTSTKGTGDRTEVLLVPENDFEKCLGKHIKPT